MFGATDISVYTYQNTECSCAYSMLLQKVLQVLEALKIGVLLGGGGKRIFEIGCANGSVANTLSQRDWNVTGVDPSVEDIQQAKALFPKLKLQNDSAYEDIA